MGTNEKELISDEPIKWVIIVSLLFILILLFKYFSIFNGGFSTLQEHWGSFGDFLGGVGGTFISAIAVLLIYRTYLLQKDELTKTSEALEGQNSQQRQQQYQNQFFKLLERKDYIISNIKYSKDIEGYGALKNILNEFVGEKKQQHIPKKLYQRSGRLTNMILTPTLEMS